METADRPQGVCVWFTGLSGAGKSTVARALVPRLEDAGRTVTVLDVVPILAKLPGERTSEGKLLRKGFVASQIAHHGGIAICVTVSRRRGVREQVRDLVGDDRFVEVFFDVPAEVAAGRRAARGRRVPLRKRVRSGARRLARLLGRGGTGYEPSPDPDVTVDTAGESPEACAERILAVLCDRGFLAPEAAQSPESVA